ncbi:MAG: DMT family transporter, partial [Clostridiales bacterium]|nr:DMT family transporter [Clostridiales bacterium]
MWLVYGILTTLAWGGADLFYKKGADEKQSLTHLKTVIMVGFVMGLHGLLYIGHMAAHGEAFEPKSFIIYFPVSAMYILSMTFSYVGLRYIELSVSSPIQNSSGALTALLCFFILGQRLEKLQIAAVVLICIGVFTLSVFEKQSEDKQRRLKGETA